MNSSQENRLHDILEMLEKGVRDVYSKDEWQNYLKAMSRFHSYSSRNSLLIYMQKPDARLVAGYRLWNTQFNRQVRKGEKGIRILAPMRSKVIEKDTDEKKQIITGFRPVAVFDISQTDGDPVPVNLCEQLTSEVDDYPLFIEALELVSPVPVHFREIEDTSLGFYNRKEKEIVVRRGMSESQSVKTLLHEITHALLHDEKGNDDRVRKEIEAESVAYAVSSYYGIDTSAYSFSYIALWSNDQETAVLKDSLATIQKTSDHLIRLINHVRNPVPGSRNRKPAEFNL